LSDGVDGFRFRFVQGRLQLGEHLLDRARVERTFAQEEEEFAGGADGFRNDIVARGNLGSVLRVATKNCATSPGSGVPLQKFFMRARHTFLNVIAARAPMQLIASCHPSSRPRAG